jgi:CDP-diacylglycerol--serine O-phosphatidyltransferase
VIPNAVTVIAVLTGFFSILITIQGMQAPDSSPFYRYAALLILTSMVLDGLDGNLARLLKGESNFGAELDTYVDITAFGIAPAILIFAVTFQSQDLVLRVLLPSAVALSGVVRLARFKAHDPLRGQGGYTGLPITVNAAWVALFVLICEAKPNDILSLGHGSSAVFFLLGIFLFIVLQVSSLRYPKPTKNLFFFVPCIVLVALLFVLRPGWSGRLAGAAIALGIWYVLLGPLFIRTRAARQARREARLAEEAARH